MYDPDGRDHLSKVTVWINFRRRVADRIATVQIVHAGAKRMRAIDKDAFVAIPLLPAWAATPGEKPKKVGDLDQLKPEALLVAPLEAQTSRS